MYLQQRSSWKNEKKSCIYNKHILGKFFKKSCIYNKEILRNLQKLLEKLKKNLGLQQIHLQTGDPPWRSV